MNKIKTAVVGVGIYSRHHINAYLNNPEVELIAVCYSDAECCDSVVNELDLPGYASLRTLLGKEDVDVISIATSDPYHKEPALQAIAKGKHVLIEKPAFVTDRRVRSESAIRMGRRSNWALWGW